MREQLCQALVLTPVDLISGMREHSKIKYDHTEYTDDEIHSTLLTLLFKALKMSVLRVALMMKTSLATADNSVLQ